MQDKPVEAAVGTDSATLLQLPASARRRTVWARARHNPLSLFFEPPYPGLSVISLLLALAVWEAFVWAFKIKIIILPPPSLVASALWEYTITGQVFFDAAATMRRVLVGLAVGVTFGVIFGLLIGWYRVVRAIVAPLVAVVFPVPKIALVPLLIIWFGVGDTYKVLLVAIAVFFIMLTNTVAGVEGIGRVTIMACRNLGANDRQIFWKVVLPGSLPVVFAALRISFSVSMILMIASEMIVSRDGIGRFIAYSGQLLETEKVFAGLVLAGFVGLVSYRVIDWAEGRLIRWRTDRHLEL